MRKLTWSLVVVLVLVAAAPFLPAGILRPYAAAALERSLDRPVEIGDIRFTFFPSGPVPGPGFVLDNVTIHEDPRAGIEPLAHMTELGVSVRLIGLLGGKLEFSGINLGDATINVVKTDAGAWNFQFLLENASKRQSPLPALRMRAGRVNFKFGDTKSPFFFNDADLDIGPGSDDAVRIGFGGVPSRTDKTAQDFGRFFIQGTASSRNLDLKVDFERSSLEETLRLIDPHGFGMHGNIALDARILGEPTALQISGGVRVGDIHRWDLLPASGDALRLSYKGKLDLRGERLELASTPGQPVAVHFKAWDFLKTPAWDAGVEFHEIPLSTLFKIGQHMGATLPENLSVEGAVSGTANYDQRRGLSGDMTLGPSAVTLPEREPIKAAEAHLSIVGGSVRLNQVEVEIGEQMAQIDGLVTLTDPRSLDLTIRTRGLSVAAMQSFGLAAIPIIEQTPQGTWSGWARHREGEWSGESELKNARIVLDGLTDPVEIATAAVSLRGRRVNLTKLKAKVGATLFSGVYNFDPAKKHPHRFNLTVDEADSSELERLFAPALTWGKSGFLARTFRIGSNPPPPWLQDRHAEGALRIDSLEAGPWTLTGIKTDFVWDGTKVTFNGVSTTLSGRIDVDLVGSAPKYQLSGAANGVPYRDGLLQVSGAVSAEGFGAKLLDSARGDVSIKSSSLLPEENLRLGEFSLQPQPIGTEPRWKLSVAQ